MGVLETFTQTNVAPESSFGLDYSKFTFNAGMSDVPIVPRKQQLKLASIGPNTVVEAAEVEPLATEDNQPPKFYSGEPDQSIGEPADFYRRGGPIKEEIINKVDYIDDGNGVITEQTTPTKTGKTYRDPMPRWLSDEKEGDFKEARIRLVDPTNPDKDMIPAFTKFFLESVQEGHTERSQVVETFGDFYAFFYGERPPIYTFAGTLLNAKNVNWVSDFMFYYENFLRGTKCAELGAHLVMTYGFKQVSGYLLNISMNTNAISERGVPFSFQMLITDRKTMNLSPDLGVIENTPTSFEVSQSILDLLQKGSSTEKASQAFKDVRKVAEAKERNYTRKNELWEQENQARGQREARSYKNYLEDTYKKIPELKTDPGSGDVVLDNLDFKGLRDSTDKFTIADLRL